jgi:protein tyrosine/serine phosphatase
MGGYKTTEGKRIRQGKIYRSGNMDSISSHGKKTLLNELKIRTDLDLRNYGQGLAGKRSPLGARVRYISIHGIMYEEVWKVSGRKGSGRTVAQNTSTLIKEMKVFANKDNYPVVFHCIYGRDRTGTLAFTLGALLGMKKADLYKDYEMTFFSEVSSKSKINIKKRVERFNKLYNYMKKYSDPKRSLQYNVERYLLDNGMTKKELHTIKKVMLK